MWIENVTSYTEEAIKDVMLAGLGDEDITRVVSSTKIPCQGHCFR